MRLGVWWKDGSTLEDYLWRARIATVGDLALGALLWQPSGGVQVRKQGAAWWDLSTAEAAAFHGANYPSRAAEFGPGFRAVLEYGRGVSGVAYATAAKVRAEFTGRLNRMLAAVDCMVCPSMSNAARPKLADPYRNESDADWGSLVLTDVHTKPFNFSGSPTLSVPCGFSADGLPFSVQFVGRALSEAMLCRVGHAFEQATTWHTRHPPM